MQDSYAEINNISIIGVIVENKASVSRINDLLSQYADYIVGRLGIPYKDKRISIICVILDAPADIVSALSGKLGMYDGVSAKTVVSKKKY